MPHKVSNHEHPHWALGPCATNVIMGQARGKAMCHLLMRIGFQTTLTSRISTRRPNRHNFENIHLLQILYDLG